jgi:hypothetical protein
MVPNLSTQILRMAQIDADQEAQAAFYPIRVHPGNPPHPRKRFSKVQT